MTRSGFVTIIGRPNVGKSTLLNELVGTKVSITSSTPNTTRNSIRGIYTEGDVQVVFVDTPGLHRATTSLGGRLNETARSSTDGVDVIVALIDAGGAIGPGDRHALATMLSHGTGPRAARLVVVVNKMDRQSRDAISQQLLAATAAVAEVAHENGVDDAAHLVEYFPTSAKRGTGVEELRRYLLGLMPEGPFFYPDDEVSDVPEAVWVAELVREQLVRKTKQELPHSIHCRVVEFEWPHVTVEILVERDSQKGIVIGKGGQLLKEVGIAARRQLPEGCYLELRVAVEPGWQQREDMLDRFGY
jgi:GTPase